MTEITLAHLLRELAEAVREAQVAVEVRAVEEYRRLLNAGSSETEAGAQPHMISLPLPKTDGTYVRREIPIAALMHHHSIALDEVRIRFSARVGWSDEKSGVTAELAPPRKPDETEAASEPVAEISLVMKRGDCPEGTARATAELLKRV